MDGEAGYLYRRPPIGQPSVPTRCTSSSATIVASCQNIVMVAITTAEVAQKTWNEGSCFNDNTNTARNNRSTNRLHWIGWLVAWLDGLTYERDILRHNLPALGLGLLSD